MACDQALLFAPEIMDRRLDERNSFCKRQNCSLSGFWRSLLCSSPSRDNFLHRRENFALDRLPMSLGYAPILGFMDFAVFNPNPVKELANGIGKMRSDN